MKRVILFVITYLSLSGLLTAVSAHTDSTVVVAKGNEMAGNGKTTIAAPAEAAFACSINGSTIVTFGTSATFTMNGLCTDGPRTSWGVSCGTVQSSSATFVVLFNTPGCNSATVTAYSGSIVLATKVVTITPPTLVGGSITNASLPAVNSGMSPAQITTVSASGGNCGSYSYQWQSSTVSSTMGFSNITGATTQNWQPGPVTVATWYRRGVTCGTQSTYTSNVAAVNVYLALVAGTVSPSTQTINSGDVPSALTVSAPSGGDGTYSYQWQSSPNGSFSAPVNVGTNAASFQPPALSALQYYRVVITSNGQPVNSNAVLVSLYPPVQAGSISPGTQNINYGANGQTLSIGGASGGNGTYTYQWQVSSSPGGTYTSISGATASSYTPTGLTSIAYYEVVTTSNGRTAISVPATVNVYPSLVSGTISPGSQTINYNTVPSTLTVSGTTGGNGSYTYQWQSCATVNGTYSPVSGATSSSYSPAALSTSIYYSVITSSNGIHITSSPVLVSVYPILLAGTIFSPGGSSLLYGTDPGSFFATGITGGNGSYSYQWQVSADNGSWSAVGDNRATYDPGVLYNHSYYRLLVTSNGAQAISNSLELTFSAPVNGPGSDTVPGGTAALIGMPAYGSIANVDNLNYVRSRVITKPGVTDTVTANGLINAYDVHQVTEYFDGLGRSMQVVNKQATPSQADLINTTFYDSAGRVGQQYLPYTDNQSTGKFRTDAATQQPSFYNGYFNNTESYYYSNMTYEASPLNRVVQATAPGKSWTGNNRGTVNQYLVNSSNDSVRLWTVSFGETDFPTTTSCYLPGTLTTNQITDENGYSVREYKDMDGQVVLKKVQLAQYPSAAHDGWLCTYYVYDDMHALRCVIPPKAVTTLKDNGWNISPVTGLCFQYAYDGRRRKILKKVPDAAPVYLVYNKKDLLVLSQDGNQRSVNQWLVTRYDTLDRLVQTGIYAAGTAYTVDAMQTLVDASQTYPSSFTLNTQAYYDDYSQVTVPSYTSTDVSKLLSYSGSYPDPVTQSSQTRGLPTATQTRVLEAPTTQWLTTVQYYDEKGRVIQSISDNISGSKDTTTSLFDFVGKVLSSYDRHNNIASRLNSRTTVLSAMTYDHMSRQTKATRQLNDNGITRTINQETYDALGQLQQKTLGNSLETLNYEYNIRGWLRGINKDYITNGSTHYFGMELNYDYGYAAPQYNGNIAGMKWKSTGDGIPRAYGYGYDPVNRLLFADFKQDNSQTGNSFADDGKVDFDVPLISYDANGNILSMKQNGLKVGGSSPIDRLSYNYNAGSNQLLAVTDSVPADTSSRLGDFQDRNTSGNDYIYDPNGNLSRDGNKNIDSIRYNYLNLPEYIHINGKGAINYVYDATGAKYQKIVTDSTKGGARDTITYIGAFVYHSDTLQFLAHEEGRMRYVNKINQVSGQPFSGFVYDYFLKDHLGNTRVVLSEEQDTTIYAATEEQKNALLEDQLFNNVNTTQYGTPSGFEPSGGADTSNHFVSRLNGGTGGNRIGPSLVLKVMARDTVNANVYGWYYGSTQTPPPGETPLINDLLSSLSNDIVGQSGGHLLGAASPVSSALSAVLPTFMGVKDAADDPAQPKAFLNWVLFDDQLNYVTGGVTQVPSISGTMSKQVMQGNIPVATKSGYLYIYLSNESQQDVFFDNLTIRFRRGPLLEENHYYPFGLSMAGISDKALKTQYAENKYRYNKGSELQNKEFSDGSGLEMYETPLRELDPQLGRWWQIDSKPNESESPYASMGNNPILHNDPLGDTLSPQQKAIFLVQPKNTDGDQTGQIRNATHEEYQENPWSALGKDLFHGAMDLVGLNTVDDESANIRTKSDNGTLTTVDVGMAALNIGLASTREEGSPVEIHIDANAHPEAAAHAENAMNNGVSGEGIIDRAGKNARRADNLEGVPTRKGKDRDEFPPAVINNGGNGQSVLHIDPSHNRGAGASIGNQIRNLPDNTRVIIVIRKPKA